MSLIVVRLVFGFFAKIFFLSVNGGPSGAPCRATIICKLFPSPVLIAPCVNYSGVDVFGVVGQSFGATPVVGGAASVLAVFDRDS